MTRFASTVWGRFAAAAAVAAALVVAVAPADAAPPRKAAAPRRRKRPRRRRRRRRAAAEAARKTDAAFRAFVDGLWPLAEARGVKRATFDAAFAGVTFDPRIVAHTTTQAEFVQPIWVYLANAVSPARVAHGRAKAEDDAPLARQGGKGLRRRSRRADGRLGHGERVRRLHRRRFRGPRPRQPRLRPLPGRLFPRRADRGAGDPRGRRRRRRAR